MTTEQHPVDTAAPLPDDTDDTTAEQYANHTLARYWYHRGEARHHTLHGTDQDTARAYGHASDAYITTALVRALIEHAPQIADNAIQDMLTASEMGLPEEQNASLWADRAGLDIGGLRTAGEEAAEEGTAPPPVHPDRRQAAVENVLALIIAKHQPDLTGHCGTGDGPAIRDDATDCTDAVLQALAGGA